MPNSIDKKGFYGFDLSMSKSKRIWGTLDPFYEPGPILGRKVANIKFLSALLSDGYFDEYHFFLPDRGMATSLRNHLKKVALPIVEENRVRIFDRRELPKKLNETSYHCFHLSDCITSQPNVARLRNRYSQKIFPITGTIHSLSYSNFADPFLRHLWPGTTARDAIVCTSSLGQRAVSNFFDWLRESYALNQTRFPAPVLARIPLAVDTDELQPGKRKDTDGPVRLLVFGRISHHSKMDLLPLVRALHRLFSDGLEPASVELILAGWADDDDDFLPTLRDYVKNVGIQTTIRLRPSETEKAALFRAADIFLSIADNPQETFGISMVEAGAFGLPSIASEYDGYRDIIIHNNTGILVPTMGPDETPDADLLSPVIFDNQYHLLLSQRTVVEIPALANALKVLIESPQKRREMGVAARQRVLDKFTWPKVIEQHRRLWDDLWRAPVDAESLRAPNHPQAIPYGRIFGHYTSTTLSPKTQVRTGRTGEAFYRGKDFPTLYSGMTFTIDPEVAKKIAFLARKPIDSADLIRKLIDVLPQMDTVSAKNHILWSLKHDILEHV